jgi:CRP-like cAMP-binding protein
MSEKNISNKPTGNSLLDALPPDDYQQLLLKSEITQLNFGEIIYEPNDIIRHVYFPYSGIVSLLCMLGRQATLEVGIIGKEGMVGLPVFLGVAQSLNLAIVQGAGRVLKVESSVFLRECEKNNGLSLNLRRYTHSLLTQISQSAVCNRFHQLDARLARWLLMIQDRMETDEFRLTQEFLSNMLGVRREAVNKGATSLQHQQLISYSRGKIKILSRTELKSVACKCYMILKEEGNLKKGIIG